MSEALVGVPGPLCDVRGCGMLGTEQYAVIVIVGSSEEIGNRTEYLICRVHAQEAAGGGVLPIPR